MSGAFTGSIKQQERTRAGADRAAPRRRVDQFQALRRVPAEPRGTATRRRIDRDDRQWS